MGYILRQDEAWALHASRTKLTGESSSITVARPVDPAMTVGTRDRLKALAFRVGVGGRLRQMKRAFEPAATTRDRADIDHLRAILGATLTPDSNCIDVGAHEGLFLRDIVRLAPGGRHIAYEPLPDLASKLAVEFPQVQVRACALSDRAGESQFVHVVSRPGWSGFRERPYPGAETVQKITVSTESLDERLDPDYVPHFIKIDVEGAEEQVLRGALLTIQHHQPLVAFEHGLGSADHYGTRPETIHGILSDECGLAIFDLDGGGPYSVDDFTRTFEQGRLVNFLARRYASRDAGTD